MSKCWCGCNSMCSCVVGCVLAYWTPFCSHFKLLDCLSHTRTMSAHKPVQLFKMKRKVGNGFYLVPVNQNATN